VKVTDTRRLTYVWIVLSVVTAVTWLLGHEVDLGHDATVAVALIVLAIAFGKVYLIIRHFMEVRTAPLWLRAFSDVWLVVLGCTIVALYLW
jgi:hypothetical protein